MICKYGYGEHIGKSHIDSGTPCQDKALCVCENGVYVAVVSDGCGSAKHSQLGSEKTVKVVANLFTERFDEFWQEDEIELRRIIVREICDSLKTLARERKDVFGEDVVGGKVLEAMDNLNATALFVAVKGDKTILGQVGDGIIGAIDDGALRIMTEEAKFEGMENATWYPWGVFYKSELAEDKDDFDIKQHFTLRKYYGERFSGFILMSDGVSALVDKKNGMKYLKTGVNTVFKAVAEGDSGEKTDYVLRNYCLKELAKYSVTEDDCSIAVLVDPDFDIIGPVYKREEILIKSPCIKEENAKEDIGDKKESPDGKEQSIDCESRDAGSEKECVETAESKDSDNASESGQDVSAEEKENAGEENSAKGTEQSDKASDIQKERSEDTQNDNSTEASVGEKANSAAASLKEITNTGTEKDVDEGKQKSFLTRLGNKFRK